jgi:uncharacterized protein (DUF2235 family)
MTNKVLYQSPVPTNLALSGPAMPTGAGLSADTIMLYCASQLKGLDDDIDSRMKTQQQHRDVQRDLNDLKARLTADHIDGNDTATRAAVLTDLKSAYDKLDPSDPARQQLENLFQSFSKTACGNDHPVGCTLATLDAGKLKSLAEAPDHAAPSDSNAVSKDEMTQMCTSVDGIINDISKGAELEMINLQSIVSQRQMAVQIATSMLSKFNEGVQSVVANVGK